MVMKETKFQTKTFQIVFLFCFLSFLSASAQAETLNSGSELTEVYYAAAHSFPVKVPVPIQKVLQNVNRLNPVGKEEIYLSLSLSLFNSKSDYQCSVFLNHPNADGTTTASDPHYIHQFQFSQNKQDKNLLRTSQVRVSLNSALARLKKLGKLQKTSKLSVTLVMVGATASDPNHPPKPVEMMINHASLSLSKPTNQVSISKNGLAVNQPR